MTRARSNEGRAFVFLGGPAGLAPLAAWSAASDQMDANLGTVGTAGDVNGDGYSDVIAGALAFDAGETDEGRAFVFHGGAGGLVADAAWSAAGGTADQALGFAARRRRRRERRRLFRRRHRRSRAMTAGTPAKGARSSITGRLPGSIP